MAANRNSSASALPEEVLEIIFSHLEPVRNIGPRNLPSENCQHDDDRRTKALSFACRASKAFYRIARPYLYRTVLLAGSKISLGRRLLLRSLLRNSSLAQSVRHLGIGRDRWRSPSKNDIRPESIALTALDEELQLLATRHLHSLPLSRFVREQICGGVKERILSSEIMCFAAICTHLQVLDLPDCSFVVMSRHLTMLVEGFSESNMIVAAARVASEDSQWKINSDGNETTPSPLSRVRKVMFNLAYSSSVRTNKTRLSAVAPMLLLPRLETLCWNMLDITRSDHARPHKVIESPKLRTAVLTNTRFNADGLGVFLRRCPNLETLCLSGSHMRDGRETHFGDVGRVIDEYGTKLQFLSLIPRNKFRKGRQIEPLGALTNLQSLRKLVVPDLFLFGRLEDDTQYYIYALRSLLPASLEELRIEGADDPFAAVFGDLLLELLIDQSFTRLRRISFRKRFWATRDFLQQIDSGVWDSSKSTRAEVALERLT